MLKYRILEKSNTIQLFRNCTKVNINHKNNKIKSYKVRIYIITLEFKKYNNNRKN